MSGRTRTVDREMKVWVPAIPLPYLGIRKRCGTCGKRFWKMETYREHYVREHGQWEENPRAMAEMPVSEAVWLGYGPWLMRRRPPATEIGR